MGNWPLGLTLWLIASVPLVGIVSPPLVSPLSATEPWLISATIAVALGAPAIVVVWRVSRRLSALAKQAQRTASGDLTAAITDFGGQDEISVLARAIATLRDESARLRTLEGEKTASAQQADKTRRQALENLASAFEARISLAVRRLSDTADDLQSSVRSLAVTSSGTTRESENVASAGARASENVRTVASAAEQLSSSINEIARRVSDSSSIAGQAVSEVARTDGSVKELASAAARIGEIVALINGIAAQTNLLALNATIEAARAGEAGKGFAVVASEVKALAGQTARATDDIRVQIEGMQVATGQTVNAIREISATIGRMSETAVSIAGAVAQQGEASRAIASSVLKVAGDAEQVSTTIASVSGMAASTDNAAAKLLGAAEVLGAQSSTMRHEVDSFLEAIRAA
jgi:methyl-accepting chemotaxis protein